MIVWLIFTLMFTLPRPILDDSRFITKPQCETYLHEAYEERTIQDFQLVCTLDDKGIIMEPNQ